MKTLKNLTLLVISLALLVSCDNNDSNDYRDDFVGKYNCEISGVITMAIDDYSTDQDMTAHNVELIIKRDPNSLDGVILSGATEGTYKVIDNQLIIPNQDINETQTSEMGNMTTTGTARYTTTPLVDGTFSIRTQLNILTVTTSPDMGEYQSTTVGDYTVVCTKK